MPTWTICKEFRFEASHQLPHHDGKCARLHGHSWRMVVRVRADGLALNGPKQGMVMDYGDLKAILNPIVEKLDHHHLNDIPGLANPTSEVISQWVALQVESEFKKLGCHLDSITIGETCTCECHYSPGRLIP